MFSIGTAAYCTAPDESAALAVYQDWAIGLVFLKIWARLVLLGMFGDGPWRENLEAVQADGWRRLRAGFALRAVTLPAADVLLTTLCVPYVLSRGGLPLVAGAASAAAAPAWLRRWASPLALGAARRWAFAAYVLARGVHKASPHAAAWLARVHDKVRDDKYMVGRRLHNIGGGTD